MADCLLSVWMRSSARVCITISLAGDPMRVVSSSVSADRPCPACSLPTCLSPPITALGRGCRTRAQSRACTSRAGVCLGALGTAEHGQCQQYQKGEQQDPHAAARCRRSRQQRTGQEASPYARQEESPAYMGIGCNRCYLKPLIKVFLYY